MSRAGELARPQLSRLGPAEPQRATEWQRRGREERFQPDHVVLWRAYRIEKNGVNIQEDLSRQIHRLIPTLIPCKLPPAHQHTRVHCSFIVAHCLWYQSLLVADASLVPDACTLEQASQH
jgi:hypothetical protein